MFGPLFWETVDGTVVVADWAEGFMHAVALRADAWEPLMRSKRLGRLLLPILALCGDEDGESVLGLDPDEEDRAMAEAVEILPACVIEIAAYWRKRRPTLTRAQASPSRCPSKPISPAAMTHARAAPGASLRSAAGVFIRLLRRSTWRFLHPGRSAHVRPVTRVVLRSSGLIPRSCPRLLRSAIGSSLKPPSSPIQAKSHPGSLRA